jgi:hypothetical protein
MKLERSASKVEKMFYPNYKSRGDVMRPDECHVCEDRTIEPYFLWYRLQITSPLIKLMIISAFFLLTPGLAHAVNYKNQFCSQQDYVGNAGNKYPHLHCGKSIFTLSRSRSDHINFHDKTNCNKVNDVLGDPTRNYGSANNPQAITNALQAYQAAGCP